MNGVVAWTGESCGERLMSSVPLISESFEASGSRHPAWVGVAGTPGTALDDLRDDVSLIKAARRASSEGVIPVECPWPTESPFWAIGGIDSRDERGDKVGRTSSCCWADGSPGPSIWDGSPTGLWERGE